MKTTLFPAFFFVLSLFFISSVIGQDEESPAATETVVAPAEPERLGIEQGDKESASMKGLILTKKVPVRLPNGYKSVVTNKQREDIYKVLLPYNEIIELLKDRIKMLEMERDKKVDAILTEEQLEKLAGKLASERHTAEKKPKKKAPKKDEEQKEEE